MQTKNMRPPALLLALSLALVGCQPPAVTPSTNGDAQAILGQNGILSNNTASLSGTVMGPATLISNNGASYRLQAAVEMGPVKQAMVYLTTPDERFYAGADGKALFAMTDDQGQYAFDKAPGEVPVVVTVMLAQNRRLVGFLVPAKGENVYHVNLATTVIAEFLRDHARLGHQTMADYPNFFKKLPEILRMTQELIDSGKLVVEDIGMTAIPDMRHAYVRAFGADYKELSDAWTEVLGYRPTLIDDYEVGTSDGFNVVAVTSDATSGALYVAAESTTTLELFEVKNGTRRTLFKGDPFGRVNALHVANGKLFVGIAGTLDPDPAYRSGGLSVFDISVEQPEGAADPLSYRTHFIEKGKLADGVTEVWLGASAVTIDGSKVYVTSDLTDEVYRYEIDWAAGSFINGERLMGSSGGNWTTGSMEAPKFNAAHDASTPGAQVTLNFPIGVTKVGNDLYVSDSSNHRVRKLDLTSGNATTVLGMANTTAYGNILKPPSALEDGKLSDSASKGFTDIDHTGGVPVASAHLAYPHTVLFDKAGHMLVGDTDHRRVRMVKDGKVYTLAGTVAGAPTVSGDSRRAGIGEIWSMAFDSQDNLLIADAKSKKLRRLWLNPTSKQN